MQRELATARCVLRAPRPGDAAVAWLAWGQDARVWRHLNWPQPRDEATLRQQLDYAGALWLKRRAWSWMLCRHGALEQPIGQLQLTLAEAGAGLGQPHHLRLGYLLAAAQWGQGLMQEAAAAVLHHALRQPDVWRVDALCDVDNPGSARLLRRLGMQCEGRLRRHSLHPACGPEPRDVWLFARVRGDDAPEADASSA
jgi:[ribosomal protein S5]-alanine N-acetyltransferase